MFPKLGESDSSQQRRGMRPPPNYSSRRVQLRLLLLVFGIMFVIVAMQRMGDPEFWRFMGFKDDEPSDAREVDGDFDSRLHFDSNGNPILPEGETDSNTADNKPLPALDRIKNDGWNKTIDKLTAAERNLLAKALMAVRDGKKLDDEDQHAWPALVKKIDEYWQEFLQNAWNAAAQLSDDDSDKKAAWLQVLSKVEAEWNRHGKESLMAAADPKSVTGEARNFLDALQARLDQLALAHVPDNTMSLGPRDRETRYRLLYILSQMSQQELDDPKIPRVGILQLARQPKNYRGKLVKIRGTARQANRVEAPANVYGIKHWYVFWVRPVGGSPQPYTVYTLELPAGFSKIGEADTQIDEDVEFTGLFFRNAGYAATDGIRRCPVLLAKAPTWKPTIIDKVALPTATAIILTVIGVAAVAIVIALVVYFGSRRAPEIVTRFSSTATNKPGGLSKLADDGQSVDVDEVLRQLSAEDD